MLDYAKIVLLGVNFSEKLFKKELIKIVSWTEPHEISALKIYTLEKYYDTYPEILEVVFVREKATDHYS